MKNNWNQHFYQLSPLFAPIVNASKQLAHCETHWPDLDDYQNLLNYSSHPVENHNLQPIKIVPQQETAEEFFRLYEPMIFCNAAVQTRQNSWHDFFQVLVWYCFPKIKATINALHYRAARKRIENDPCSKQRGKLENFLTLFDECGSVIVSSNNNLIDLIREFRWKELFIQNRAAFSKEIECVVFGHAIYEKAISPYIGMTAQCLFLKQPASFFDLTQAEKNRVIDSEISTILWQQENWTSKELQPLPLLGIPGWHSENENPEFYNNEKYFRKKSAQAKT